MSRIPALTGCQDSALNTLERQGNIFLTGAAGTGKSFLLEHYLRHKHVDAFPVVASTGAAAVLIGGRTFHSFFGLGIMEGGLQATIARALRSRKLMLRLQRACCVVIDEISMLSGTTIHAAEQIARRARNVNEPWGGLRIIAVGDFAQLPPVTPGNAEKDWAFLHPTWLESAFQPALLSTVMRTRDADFLDILNFVRAGIVNDDVRRFLESRRIDSSRETEGTRLYPHRAKAEEYNLRRLHSIPGVTRSFETQYDGEQRVLETAKRAMPIPDVLLLKEGALVMMRKNDASDERLFVNGSLGHVHDIGEDTLRVTLLGGEKITVEKQKFSYLDGDGNELMGAWNFPVTLAWATTIHKAQGASLDRMIVDLSALWEPGQAYVALSRVRSSEGLFIERWSPSSIRAEPLVTSFYDSLAEEMQTYTPRPLYAPDIPEMAREERTERPARKRQPGATRRKRAEMIQSLIERQTPLANMAATCGVQEDRILHYVEKMLLEGRSVDVDYLLSDVPEASRIRAAFEEHGIERLRPVFDALREEIPYPTLRLVRCVMAAENAA